MSERVEHSWRDPGSRETMATLLIQRAAESPDAIYAAIEGAGEITYRELDERTQAMAKGLRQRGICQGAAVATLLENHVDGVALWYACGLLGAIYVPLNTALHGSFLTHQLRTAKVQLLMISESRLEDIRKISSDIDDVVEYLCLAGESTGTPTPDLGGVKTVLMNEVISAGTGEAGRIEPIGQWKDPAVVLFTAGTTGASKGAVLSHRFLVHMAEVYVRNMQIGPGDVFYTGAPLFHLSGGVITLLSPLVAGAKAALDRTFSLSAFWRRVRETGATHSLLFGSTIHMLWNREMDDDERANTLRAVVFVPMPAELHRPFEERFGLRAVTGFGQTEGGTIALSSVDEPAPIGWGGKPLPSYEVIIGDDDGRRLPPHTPGEIMIRPLEPHIVFEGYCGEPASTLEVLSGLWLHTGDVGEMDEEGNMRFLDRKNDYLRRRGENISSMEVERVLAAHDAIADVAVIGVPSEMAEDEVKACAVLKDNATLTEHDLIEYCIQSLPYFAVPRFVEFFSDLPKNPVGKTRKIELRKGHQAGSCWDREAAGVRVTRQTRAERAAVAPS